MYIFSVFLSCILSNIVFLALEFNQMAKLVKDLEKENEIFKSKCEKSDIALVRLVEEVR